MLWLLLVPSGHASAQAAAAPAPRPTVYWGAVARPQAPSAPGQSAANQQIQQLMQALMTAQPPGYAAGGGTGGVRGSAPPAAGTDFDTYNYPENYQFSYGGKGAGNIGNGLCTAKNGNRTQVSAGYCKMLADVLNTEGTCANRYMMQIIAQAGQTGSGVGDLTRYCSTWSQLHDTAQKSLVFEQILAGLIVRESGWNKTATEKPWYKNGRLYQGKGLLQIGTWYSSMDADCADVTDQTIYDPKTNLKCGACVALKSLATDMTIGHGHNDDGSYGIARIYGPFRDGQAAARGAIASATNQYCEQSTGTPGRASQPDSRQ